MKVRTARTRHVLAVLFLVSSLWVSQAFAEKMPDASPLAGTWTLAAADVVHPDGSRGPDFGAKPLGLLVIDRQGHYSLQIYKSERTPFASGDKAKGTDAEYKAAVMDTSAHFGTVRVDSANSTLIFHLEGASYPNWQGQDQSRRYELKGDMLSYRVAPRPNGDVAISVWHRIN